VHITERAGFRPDVPRRRCPFHPILQSTVDSSDRQRIANLEQLERTTSAYVEQRRSAALEIRNIRSGALARMSADDLKKKDNYWADLGKLDADRRRAAAEQLANLFASYQ